nr:zinc finger protein 250-like isoform X1 [Anolis sagrei ordinatus]
MASDVETRLLLARQIKMEPNTEEIDNSIKLAELPNLVQCGTIGDLLHDIAPQQPPPGPSHCWEDAWKQVLEALDADSLPHVQRYGSEGNKEVHSSQGEDASEERVSESSLSLSLENMWMLQFRLGDDIESCLESFEQAAKAHHWPKEEWVAHLKPHLSPKAFLACCDVAGDYSVVKASILQHHGITPEIQWRCFRQYRYHKSKGPREACRKLRALAWRWLKDLSKERVLEQLVLEQFLDILPQEMQSWVRRCGPETCAQAVDLAEGFQLGKKPPVSFKDVSVKFSDAEWALLSEKQRTLYQDTMLENFQNVSSLGFPREKHKFIAQIKKGGKLDFQDGAERGYLLENELTGNLLLPVSKEYCMEKKGISKKAKKPAEKTQEHSGQVQSFGNEPSSPEMQPISLSPTKVPSVKTQPTKRRMSSPKGRKHQKKERRPPTPEGPPSNRKQSPPSLPREAPDNQELSDDAVSTHNQEPEDVAKPRKRKKVTPSQSGPPKPKKQAVLIEKHFKMKKKSKTQEEPQESQGELPVPEKTSPCKKSQRQQEAQQAPSPDENAKPHRVTTACVTWHPPVSATVVSDLTCLECGRSFKQRADLRHHQYVHTREKPYACSMCSKCFRHPSHLHIHQRTHSGERPYKCPECGKTFSQSCNLRTHRQIHTGKKPFQCSVCNKCFYHRSNLTIHKRVHTGERPYSCSVCPKSFSDRSTLVQHERTHTGERPYACLVCKQRFSQMSHLTKHSRVHSDARGQPKTKPTRVLVPSPPKNCMSQPNGKDGSFKKTEAKQDQHNLTSISKTLVSSSPKNRLPQNKDAT